MQELVWDIALLVIAAIAAIFLTVAVRAKQLIDPDRIHAFTYGFRAKAFAALVIVGIAVAVITLRQLPYVKSSAVPVSQVVNASGFQWYWDLDRASAVAGQPVEFRVTGGDVTHGFGIYDDSGRLLAQTQAMPNYTNRLLYTFDTPGTYRILCLEYCGIAHHGMVSEFEVTAP
ncbi:MAG: cytochrome c oxidase subunit II [Thermomicrobiales bacterium]|nr:cytochrome c oxidase subunit II [Thermomicrobiales bacterium]